MPKYRVEVEIEYDYTRTEYEYETVELDASDEEEAKAMAMDRIYDKYYYIHDNVVIRPEVVIRAESVEKVSDYTDDELWESLRGGGDPSRVLSYASQLGPVNP